MKRIFMYFLVFLIGISSISPIVSVSALTPINTSRYQTIANRTIKLYIKRLDNAQYINTEILSALSNMQTLYVKMKSFSTYRGTRKYQIDAIVIALGNAITEVSNRDNTEEDVYNLFNQTPAKTLPKNISCTQELKMCSDGSYVSRSGSSCNFATCPTVSTSNNITGATSVLVNGMIKTDFNAQNQNSFYKEYDIYIYTPNATNNQPSAYSFIPKPEKLIYNYYSSYTITTNFQSETDTTKVSNIRTLAQQYPRNGKSSKFLSKDSLFNIFGILGDESFYKYAVNTSENGIITTNANYSTYLLYIAKDNSEAFTVNYVQSGRKSTVPVVVNNVTGVSSNVVNGVIKTTFNTQDKNSFYKEYDIYVYTPTVTNNQPLAYSFIPKPEKLIYNYYNSYTITTNFQSETDAAKVNNIRTLAEQYPRTGKSSKFLTKNSVLSTVFNIFGPLPDDAFSRNAIPVPSTGISNYTTYFLYVAKDNSEAFTVNYVQSGKKK